MNNYDVIVIGAGAAGLMAAATAAKRGRKILLLESTNNIAAKIRISGGGRCNFTNLDASPKNYLSQNPHFAISALSRYTQADFIKLVESYDIAYHEKTLGQLFCDNSSQQIIDMLVNECLKAGVEIRINCSVSSVRKYEQFQLESNQGYFICQSLIIATGGLSIPKMGASDFGYRVARQFGLSIAATRPALVPLTIAADELEFCCSLSGVSAPAIVTYKKASFEENILFTHRGLSGPAILQISSYISELPSSLLKIDLLPGINLKEILLAEKNCQVLISSFLKDYLPKRFVDNFCQNMPIIKKLVDCKNIELEQIAFNLKNFKPRISSTEGYAKAEVTAGGVDTAELSSKTMEANKVTGLYFIGEVVDITGWLGGYNFQWAWSSGFAAGSYA